MIPFPAGLDRLDQDLFRAVNGWLHAHGGGAADAVLSFANETGNAVVAGPVLAAAWVLGRRHPVLVFLQVGLALLLVSVLNGELKHAVGRPRPQAALEQAFRSGEVKPCFGEHPRRMSFPSGHTATYGALATVVAAWATALRRSGRRRLSWITLFVGFVLLALARVYAGAHYPLDTVAGAVVGVVAGLAALGLVALATRVLSRLRGPRRSDLPSNAGWTP